MSPATRTPVRSPWLLTAWAAGLVAVGGIALAGAWHHWLPVVLLLVAGVVPMLLLRSVVSLGVSRWAAASVLALLLVLVAYLMSARSGTSLAGTLSDSVPLLLTSPQPYPVRADLLAAPILLTGLISLFAGLRAESRTRVAPVAAGVLLYVAAALLTSGGADPAGILAVLLVVLAVLGWVLLDEHPEPARRRLAIAAPALVVLVGALASVALLPSQDPYDPRVLVDPPVTVVETSSPLPQLGAWAANPDAELLRVTGDAVPLRLVTLDDYDGAQWRAATRYAPLGTTSPEPLTGERRRTSTVTVTLAGLGGNWLPSPGDPTRVSEPDAVVDTGTGTLYDPVAAADTSYDITGVVDRPDPADLVNATVPTSGPALAYLRQPDLPFELARYAEQVIPDATTPYEQALAIEAAVQGDRRLSPRAISGSAFWRIERFLLGRGSGGQVGTSEQFATSFAILARQAGLPTRVVVGFRPGHEQPDGSRIIRSRDALAWPEVYFNRLGWVPFSPTPHDDTFSDGRPELGEMPEVDPAPAPTAPVPSDGTAPGPVDADATPPSDATAEAAPWVPAVMAGGVLVLPLLLLGGARQVRSLRHRRRGATGAWAEVYDALVLAGSTPPRWETAPDAADRADRRFGTDAATRVAVRAERAAFGPAPAPTAAPADEVRAVRRAARASLPWWRRWWWSFDPRVLGR
ncbi:MULTISPECIES: transglutaminaseTgpA domain-containing protein [unclassified Nocardioides]|uniref:transglutaminase family protein n=1 Tax=unclassified Nocardioides TaxID=2615069 RepID=UPI0009F0881F|nr:MULTISPECIES: transglutaminase domain-containing protein [unclassified Nocardioides]GAW47807.1 Putative membrane protein [Nocardioides sp. PD653-B2]GAW53559.1 putative membrane protein [Nocardioides sp. PD653]